MGKSRNQENTTALSALADVSYEELIETIADRVVDKVLEHIAGSEAPQEFLNARAVTQMLGISMGTLQKRIEEGVLPQPVIGYGKGHGHKRLWKREQFK